jgi:hypothetical protein
MKDLHNVIGTKEALAPAASTTVAGRTGKIIDLLGYGGVEFLVNYGAVTATNATITPVLLEGSVTGTLTSVADADMLGTELLASLPAQATSRTSGVGKNVTTRLGYKGSKRYVQLNIASATVTAATIISAVALLHTPNVAPVANP